MISTSGLRGSAKRWRDAALSFFYPEVCQACGKNRAAPGEGYVCAQCAAAVKFIAPPYCKCCGAVFEGAITSPFQCGNCEGAKLQFVYARAAVPAKGVVMDILHQYKYSRAIWVEPFLTELFIQIAAPVIQAEGWDLIIPVPLHPRRKAEREFNQAERLGRALSRASRIPFATKPLRRVEDTPTQTNLSKSERAENVRRAFLARGNTSHITGQRIVLVDDVLTTGATASAAAGVLRRHGAAEVCAWTLARGLLH